MKLAVFDCDGTLIDSQVNIIRAMEQSFQRHRLPAPDSHATRRIVGLSLVEAMQAGVPGLCSGNSSMPEVAGEAGLFFDPLQPEDIAAQLSRVYKDEPGRSEMIRRGLERASAFRWEDSARRVSEIMREAADRG